MTPSPSATSPDATFVVDAMRRSLLAAALRVSSLRRVIARRDRRLGVQSLVSVVAVAAATLLAPGALLVLGPIVFGVPHLTGDVRHLVIRRDVPRNWACIVAVACAALLALRVAELAAPTRLPYAGLEMLVGWSWVVSGVVLGAIASKSLVRATLIALPLAFLTIVTARSPTIGRAAFAYVHNLVALVVWVALFRKQRMPVMPAIAAALTIAAFFASGVLVASTHWNGPWAGRVIDEWVVIAGSRLAPRTAVGIGLSYVFLQAIHYAVWVAWIPQDDMRAQGTMTFRMTARAFRRDLGAPGAALAVVAALVILVGSLVRVHPTRAIYLSLAAFHGWLELSAIAFFAARGHVGRAHAPAPR